MIAHYLSKGKTPAQCATLAGAIYGACAILYCVPALIAAGVIAGWWTTGDSLETCAAAVALFGLVALGHAAASLFCFNRAMVRA